MHPTTHAAHRKAQPYTRTIGKTSHPTTRYPNGTETLNSASLSIGAFIPFRLTATKSLEKRGIVLGVSTHRAENAWFFNGGMKYASDVRDTDLSIYGRRYDDQAYTDDFAKEWLDHTKELVDKYQPKIVYFDWTVNNPVIMPYFNKFLAYYYNNSIDWKQGVVVNTKQGYPTDVMVWDVERGKSGKMMKYPWQTDTFVGTKSWGYIADEVYKTPGQIVDDLVDIVSKNGNLLLNIGPKPDGTIPEPQKNILLSIGKWLDVNGEAIYGSRC